MSVTMIWPTRRVMHEREVIAWAHDRMIDEALDLMVSRVGRPLPDAAVDKIANDADMPTLDEAIERLQSDGVATFRR